MEGICVKCGFEGEFHQVGRDLDNNGECEIIIAVIQCPKCCFLKSVEIGYGLGKLIKMIVKEELKKVG